MVEFQADRAAHIVRISELEGEILRLRGEQRASRQLERSLRSALKRAGVVIPKHWTTDDED